MIKPITGQKITSKKLTVRYSIHFLLFYSVCAGTSSFAATYLLDKGFQASQIGVLLAMSNLLSCFLQPLLGDFADRLKSFRLPQIMAGFLIASFLCYGTIQVCNPPLAIFGILYCAGLLLMSVTISLCNSLCAYYTNHNCPINYGVGTGIGSLAFSFASLGYGYVIAWFGADSMLQIALTLTAVLILVVLGYPKLTGDSFIQQERKDTKKEERVSLLEFFGKYKIFTVTMLGVMLLAMCHMMSESYFIAIFEAIGGGSEDVGIGLFVACISAAPFYMIFEKMLRKISIYKMMKLSGVFFMLKMFLLLIATQVWHIYVIELLQIVTYGFVYQPLYYFAREKVSESDLVKGQSVAVSLYTLGAALGSFVGGRTLDAFGVAGLLKTAFVAACVGTIIICTVLRKEK